MTIEEKLQNFILTKYKSIMQFSKKADIPYTTVKGMFTRGIWGASVQNVTRMCEVLNIDVDKLICGQIVSKDVAYTLNAHEQKVIVAYRQQPSMQEAVDRLLGVEEEYIEQKEKHA